MTHDPYTSQISRSNQRHVLIGKQWYQLPELIPTHSNSEEQLKTNRKTKNTKQHMLTKTGSGQKSMKSVLGGKECLWREGLIWKRCVLR